jgi:hypothetical protein
MAGRYNSITGLDESSQIVQAAFLDEIGKPEFSGLTLTMAPTGAWDRHPKFTIGTPKDDYLGQIAEEDVHVILSQEQLRELVRTHLIAARDGDF